MRKVWTNDSADWLPLNQLVAQLTPSHGMTCFRIELLLALDRTPCVERVYNALPPESRQGRVQLLVPNGHSAGVVHLAATGDQGFGRRLRLGWPMMQQVRTCGSGGELQQKLAGLGNARQARPQYD